MGQTSAGKKTYGYETRNKNLPNILPHDSNTFNKCFLCKAIGAYSHTSVEIKNSNNIKSMVKKVKSQMEHN